MGLRADAPAVPAHFFINLLLKASLAYFPHLYLFWVLLANIPIMLAYFIFLGLPQPIYFIFTSFTLMGFLVDPLGFLSPITTSLHFITFWAYWPLSQPNEFINSFLGLPQPIYFLFTFYYSHRLITSFFGLHWPIYSFFTSFYSCGPAGQWSCHFILLGLFPYSLTIFHFSHFLYCWASSAIGPFVKSGHQHMSSKVVSNWISLSLSMRKKNINKEIR